jgi:hypothetical protein
MHQPPLLGFWLFSIDGDEAAIPINFVAVEPL